MLRAMIGAQQYGFSIIFQSPSRLRISVTFIFANFRRAISPPVLHQSLSKFGSEIAHMYTRCMPNIRA
jgi:hypothetical protein